MVTAFRTFVRAVLTVKVPDLEPFLIKSAPGVVADAGSLLERVTTISAGAAIVKETVPLAEVPPLTEEGDTVIEASPSAGVTVSVAYFVGPGFDARTTTGTVTDTGTVAIVKLPEF